VRQLVAFLLPAAKTLISIVKMPLQEGKKRVKRSGERETMYNVHKFMKLSEVGITIPLSSVQKRVIEATRVSRRTFCRIVKEGKNVKHVAMPFSTPRKLRPKKCTKSILDGFNEAVLRGIVHSFYLTEKERPTLKAINAKIRESACYEGVSSLRKILRRMN
jgi:hypothetical protein